MGKRAPVEIVFGIGINDLKAGRKCPFFQRWRNMLDRCYGQSGRRNYASYVDCTVAPEWLVFSVFKAWMMRQPWEGGHLDKDLLFPGNRVYGPEFCVFVDAQTNTLLNQQVGNRGEYPIGVSLDKSRGGFQSKIRRYRRTYNLGRYSDPMIAHSVWQREKARLIREIALTQTDWRVAVALEMRADMLDEDRRLGRESR
jgi:hypothetical protein